ncbi:MAG TPA: amidohydrolase family protein, partial [Kofleriaceae bacterium]|nr:amidohydrolase family protein [Kofleriaceae bacterium]
RIVAVGPSRTTKVPAGAQVRDLTGKALVPGLMDMHAHLDDADGILNLASGVTLVRDVGNQPDKLDAYKRAFDEGKAIGPHVVRLGFIEGRNEKAASSVVTAETPAEARAAVELFAQRGYQGIKIYNSVRPELVPLLTAEAHRRGMSVTGHVPVHMLAEDVVRAGFDGIEHITMLFLNFFATRQTDTRDTTRFTLVGDHAPDLDLASAPVQAFLRLLRDRKVVIDPTVNAFEDLLVWEQGKVAAGLEELAARLPVLPRQVYIMGGLPVDAAKHQRYVAAFDKLLQMTKALVDAKVRVVIGTDALAGLMYHHELRLFARAGIPAAEILRMATILPARYLGMERQHGSIAVGEIADLVVIEGDPLARIADLGNTVTVMRAGIAYSCGALYAAIGVRP